ncbi:MAG: hypothetical protein P0Y53_01475 [Candidatus Pseudobacter hemicellulosilyticus]|uniref:Uncharacterized protein n=1 Tax=Candidatus Pseudobacter hemicellulosilyticus TaxID=3121375 RepID=A0AAJ5WT83_9BACT|nr:MAG: hypothetical protein P0Y53_01475 [Pseudobacter sp.]
MEHNEKNDKISMEMAVDLTGSSSAPVLYRVPVMAEQLDDTAYKLLVNEVSRQIRQIGWDGDKNPVTVDHDNSGTAVKKLLQDLEKLALQEKGGLYTAMLIWEEEASPGFKYEPAFYQKFMDFLDNTGGLSASSLHWDRLPDIRQISQQLQDTLALGQTFMVIRNHYSPSAGSGIKTFTSSEPAYEHAFIKSQHQDPHHILAIQDALTEVIKTVHKMDKAKKKTKRINKRKGRRK